MIRLRWVVVTLAFLALLAVFLHYQQQEEMIANSPVIGPSRNLFLPTPSWQESEAAKTAALDRLRNRYMTYMAGIVLIGILGVLLTMAPSKERYSADAKGLRQ